MFAATLVMTVSLLAAGASFVAVTLTVAVATALFEQAVIDGDLEDAGASGRVLRGVGVPHLLDRRLVVGERGMCRSGSG